MSSTHANVTIFFSMIFCGLDFDGTKIMDNSSTCMRKMVLARYLLAIGSEGSRRLRLPSDRFGSGMPPTDVRGVVPAIRISDFFR